MKLHQLAGVLCPTMLFSACGKMSEFPISLPPSDDESYQAEEQPETKPEETDGETQKSELTPAFVVVPDNAEYVEMKQSPDGDSSLCRLYTNDEVTLNFIDGEYANISANGFDGYVAVNCISFTSVENAPAADTPAQDTPAQDNAPAAEQVKTLEVPAATNPPADDQINIENNITIQFDVDDFGIKYARPLSYPKYVEDKTEGYCLVDSCYIYAEPSTASEKTEKYMVYKDSGVEILGTVGDWYFIRRDFGSQSYRIGYVPKEYFALGPSPEIPPSLCSQIIVTAESAWVNKTPKIGVGDENRLGLASNGEVYDVYDLIDNYWYKIGYGSGYGYISHKMVEPYN